LRSSDQQVRRLRFAGSGALAWLLLATCVAVSVSAALLWHARVRDDGVRAFQIEAGNVGSSATTALRRIDDVTVSLRNLVVTDRALNNRALARWYASMNAGGRYPGLLGFTYFENVAASQLGNFTARLRADPSSGKPLAPGRLMITPPGSRPNYCLIRFGASGPSTQTAPGVGPGLDVCAIPGGAVFAATRDSGQIGTVSLALPGTKPRLLVMMPVYRGGVTPATQPARRSQLVGWAMGQFDVASVLGSALSGERNLMVSIYRRNLTTSSSVSTAFGPVSSVAHAGTVSSRSPLHRTFTIDADGRWIVTVARDPQWGSLTPTVQGIAVFAAGALVGLLAFALVQLLARGRTRALRLVDEKTEQLRHQAFHDSLTSLPNRALIMDRADQMLARARRRETTVTALFIDLDGFKTANDTFGHAAGDEVLRQVANRIRGVLRESDSVGRLGGDEFIVLLDGDGDELGSHDVAKRLLATMRRPYELDEAGRRALRLTASIGIASTDRGTSDDLLRDADTALYKAKAAGRDQYVIFQATMHNCLALEISLREAIHADQLFLAYQPIVELRDGAITGLEALLRWNHPTLGLMAPDQFIPLAEETGLIVDIGAWVLQTACKRAAVWHAHGYEINVSVNVSARQLEDPDFGQTVHDALELSGLDPDWLILEITETAMMHDAENTARLLGSLRPIGIRVAIDDFGTGYSSLSHLQHFPVDALKIDRSFVAGIPHSAESRALVHTMVQLGKSLELDIIAEGIEEVGQQEYLRGEGCEGGQGFLFARPLDVTAVDAFLSEHWQGQKRDMGTEPDQRGALTRELPSLLS
jgi:diguanylate cyclase (GGDEF)-like protein